MAVQILLNQVAKPPGVAGFAREDLATGVPVDISLVGGPFVQQQWTVLDKPIDLAIPAQSNAFITDPTAAVSQVQNVDRDGTYLLQVVVDAGFGLGARPEDIARITFYAGAPLNSVWDELPRRIPAFLEKLEHNVQNDPIFGLLGNLRGWAEEWLRWFGVIVKAREGASAAWGLVELTSSGSTLLNGVNTASAVRSAIGKVQVTFITPLPNANYAASATARGTVGGSCTCRNETINGFVVERADPFGVLTDDDFTFDVKSR